MDKIHADMEPLSGTVNNVSFEMFMAEVYNEYHQRRYLEEITEKEREATELVKQLRVQVEKERRLKEQEIAERSIKQAELDNALHELRELTAEESEKNKLTKEAEFDTRRRIETRSLAEMNQELQNCNERLSKEDEVHESMNGWLKSKIERLMVERNEWETKAEKEIGMEMQRVNALTTRRDTMQRNLEERKREYEEEVRLKTEREQREQRLAEEERMQQESMEREIVTKIMLAYKCYKARILLEQLTKEKGGKKKKAKSGKEKKK